jgi:hypothetical protein
MTSRLPPTIVRHRDKRVNNAKLATPTQSKNKDDGSGTSVKLSVDAEASRTLVVVVE